MLHIEGHEIYGVQVSKISLSSFDSKRYIAENRIDTLVYRHRLTEELDTYISELLEVILSKEAQSLAWAHFVNSREQALWECWSILQCCRPLKTRQGLWLFHPHPSAFQLTWFMEISYIDKGGEFFFHLSQQACDKEWSVLQQWFLLWWLRWVFCQRDAWLHHSEQRLLPQAFLPKLWTVGLQEATF